MTTPNPLGHVAGTVYRSHYWREHYLVLRTTRSTTTVVTCDEAGKPLPNERERTHMTRLDARDRVVHAAPQRTIPAWATGSKR